MVAARPGQACDAHLREIVCLEQTRRWRNEQAGFINAYNEPIENEELTLDFLFHGY